MSTTAEPITPPVADWRRRSGMLLGPGVAAVMLLAGAPQGIAYDAWVVAALTVLMATWWVTEAVPISATALLPIVVLPLSGVRAIGDVTAPYAHPLIFLFLGGFLIALAIQRWNLHLRIALGILHLAGQRPDRIVGGFMGGTALLSMWVSNTATAAMMLPIGLSVLIIMEGYRADEPAESQRRFAVALLLGIAFGANIGGIGTLIGTPPNALLAAFMLDTYGVAITFGEWMLVGVPVAMTLLAGTWWILTRWAFPLERHEISGVQTLIARKRVELGPMSPAERRVLAVFTLTALAWVLRPWIEARVPGLRLSDAGIAVTGALALFLIPSGARASGALLEWSQSRDLPWGVLLLVGGGLSLGTAIEHSGLAGVLADALAGLGALPVWLIVAAVALLTMLLSHVTSNTAAAATLLPVVSSLALGIGQPPLMLAVPVALAASCAFMLPVATPPNAIVFGSERLTVADMVRAGSRITALALIVVLAAVMLLALPVLD